MRVPRQQTLSALIAWSYGLLDPAERCLLERLSVFVGGFDLAGGGGGLRGTASHGSGHPRSRVRPCRKVARDRRARWRHHALSTARIDCRVRPRPASDSGRSGDAGAARGVFREPRARSPPAAHWRCAGAMGCASRVRTRQPAVCARMVVDRSRDRRDRARDGRVALPVLASSWTSLRGAHAPARRVGAPGRVNCACETH